MTNHLPAFLQQRQSKPLADTISSNVGAGSPPYVSIMGNRFTLVDAVGDQEPITTMDPKTGMVYLDCCIADAGDHESKIYYSKPFDANATSWSPPDCWSDNGIGPSRNASVPQAPACGTCPKAVWGSATSNVSGKGIPACAQYQFISVLLAGHQTPFLLRIPPNSLKNYRAYAEQFRGQQFDMDQVMTRLSFISQGTLAFIPCGWATVEQLAQSDQLITAKATDSMVGRLDVAIQGALPAPQGAPAPVQEQPAPFVPAVAAAPASQPAALQTETVGPAAGPAASSTPTVRRRRNTAAAAPTQPATAPQQTMAPFMEPAAATLTPNQDQPVQNAQPQPSFGMSPGVPPNADLSATLDNLFGPAK